MLAKIHNIGEVFNGFKWDSLHEWFSFINRDVKVLEFVNRGVEYCSSDSDGDDQEWKGLLAKVTMVWDKDIIFGMFAGNNGLWKLSLQ